MDTKETFFLFKVLVMWVIGASKFFLEEGAKLVGVVEFDGRVYDPNGIDLMHFSSIR